MKTILQIYQVNKVSSVLKILKRFINNLHIIFVQKLENKRLIILHKHNRKIEEIFLKYKFKNIPLILIIISLKSHYI